MSCTCYRLTPDSNNHAGSVFNVNKIDLDDPFDFSFEAFLGCDDAGADGIAFLLQPVGTGVGSGGGGLGYQGISPSLAVEFDTYQNGWDPAEDHIAIQEDGDNDHGTGNNLAGPVDALTGGGNIEDCGYHDVRITWDPSTNTLDIYFDGDLRLSYTGDIVNNIFGGTSEVYWGFTGSTGGAKNDQRFCIDVISNFIAPPFACKGDPVQFTDSSYATANNVVEHQWDFGDGSTDTVSSPDHVYSSAGTYDVELIVTSEDGCKDTVVKPIEVFEGPTASFTTDTVCFGNATAFTDLSSPGDTTLANWGWAFGDGDTTLGQNPSHSYTSPGTYSVGLIVEDQAGCRDTTIAPHFQPDSVQVDVSNDTTICIDGTATLSASASGGTPGYTYHWDQGLGTGPVKNVSPGSNTTYNIYAVDASSCTSSTAQVTVQIHPPLTVSALSDDSICLGDVSVLDANTSGGSGTGYSYSWSNGSNAPSTSVSPNDTTVYTVTVEDDCETPPAQDSVEIVVHDPPEAKFSEDDLEGCRPVTASFTNETDPSMTDQCLWEFGNGELSDACGQTSATFTEEGCHDVKLKVISPEGCVDSVRKTDLVCVRPYPVADFTHDPQDGAGVQDPEFSFTNLSTGAVSHEWRFGGLDTTKEVHPEYAFPADGAGSYEVCLTALNTYGCKDSICRQVNVEGEFILYVPNAFTPDGDGVNDEFGPVVQGADETDYSFTIRDRWGQVVFRTEDPGSKWDGTNRGSGGVKPDVYVWRLVTKNKYNGKAVERTGHVTVIR